ncbi:NTF2 fold immunity protein [Candidatus Pantoea multigeneris]|uniref:NTF2 fold immunity protein domain-containing protein n=1 Tax=Candidatus Pantoea multigeneris TaxID=2608357 RepID=A0ABX0RFS8_9GAMM|nr:NTF2 fold immunity protein [Pantoea multigeneris]NIF22090.1 hypothetical protein [Pantoea multigeneris]
MNAKEILICFIEDMGEWENSFREAFMENPAIDKQPYSCQLDEIFNKWCTKKERKYGRQVSMQVSFPPDYDIENDEITSEDISAKKTLIQVKKNTGFKNEYRYTLIYKEDRWQIDKKEWLDEGKWKRAYL